MDNEYFKSINYGNDPIVHYEFKKRYITAKDLISYEGLDKSVKIFKFKGTLFKEDVDFKLLFFDGFNYQFSNCEFESFNFIEPENITIIIINSKFSNSLISFLHAKEVKLVVHGSLSSISLSLLNCDNLSVEMINNVPLEVAISDSEISKFKICNIHSKKGLIFNSNKTTFSELEVINFHIDKFIFIASCFVDLLLGNSECDDIILFDLVNKSVSSIRVHGSKFSNLLFSGGYEEYVVDLVEEFHVGKIDSFQIYNSSNINLKYIDINDFSISGSYNRNVLISFCSVNILNFQDFNCLNSFRIESLKKLELDKFSIMDSNLMNVEIVPSFFHYVKSFAFNNSSIIGIKVIGFEKIPESVIENSSEMSILQKIDFARELSALMIEQNNHYLTTVYRALEQDFRLESNKFNSEFDKVILILNSLSNSHGTRPEKALFLILIIILTHFSAMRIEFALINNGLFASDFFWNNISYYVKPFTFISDMNFESYTFSKGFIVFDMIYKISFGYLLYQFIAAFRKFNK